MTAQKHRFIPGIYNYCDYRYETTQYALFHQQVVAPITNRLAALGHDLAGHRRGRAARVGRHGCRQPARLGVELTVGDNGYLTNRITKLAGGLEITRPDAHANQLVVTTPGRIHLSFESDPVATGPYWGLRIPGDRVTYLAALTNAPARLTWSDAGLHAMYKDKVKIFKDATYTYVGVDVTALPPAPPVLGTIGYTR